MNVCSVKDLLMNVGDQFSKDEVSRPITYLIFCISITNNTNTNGNVRDAVVVVRLCKSSPGLVDECRLSTK